MKLFVVYADGSRRELFVNSDFEPDFEYKNAAVEFDQIPGALSFNQKIPIEGNAQTLNQAHHIATRTGDLLFDLEGFVNGELRVRGKLLIDGDSWQNDDDYYQISLIATDFSSAIEGQTLKTLLEDTIIDFVYGEASLLDGITATVTDDDSPVKFPTYFNASHFGDAVNAAFDGVLNEYNGATSQYLQNASSPVGGFYENRHTYSPWVRVFFVLEQIFKAAGYSLKSDLNTRDFGKVIQYSGVSIDYFEDVSLMIVASAGATTDAQIPWDFLIESTQTTPTVVPTIEPYVIESEGVLQIDLTVAIGTSSSLNFVLYVELDGNPILQWVIVDHQPNTVYELQETFDSTGNLGGVLSIRIFPYDTVTLEILPGTTLTIKNATESAKMKYYDNLRLSRLMPEISVAEYLLAVRKYFNLKFSINPVTRLVSMEHCVDLLSRPFTKLNGITGLAQTSKNRRPTRARLKLINEAAVFDSARLAGDVLTVSELSAPVIGKVVRVLATGAYYRYELNEDTNLFEWREIGKSDISITWGDGQETVIEIPCELISMQYHGTISARCLMPAFDEEGISDAYNSGGEQSILRFAMWHGLQPSNLGIQYPLASPHNYNGNGTELDTLALHLSEDDHSVYVELHKDWLPVIFATKTIEKEYIGAIDPYQVTDRALLLENQLFIVESVVKVESENSERALLKLRLL